MYYSQSILATSTAVTVTAEKIGWCQQKAADSRASWVQLAVIGIDDCQVRVQASQSASSKPA
jgi:hypothetical protein